MGSPIERRAGAHRPKAGAGQEIRHFGMGVEMRVLIIGMPFPSEGVLVATPRPFSKQETNDHASLRLQHAACLGEHGDGIRNEAQRHDEQYRAIGRAPEGQRLPARHRHWNPPVPRHGERL